MMCPNPDVMKNICLAVLAVYHFKPAHYDCQPDCLTDDATMVDSLGLTLPKKVKLSLTLTMHKRNNKIILQYHKPNENLFPQMLMSYYLFLMKVI